jgi:hypothetical protein
VHEQSSPRRCHSCETAETLARAAPEIRESVRGAAACPAGESAAGGRGWRDDEYQNALIATGASVTSSRITIALRKTLRTELWIRSAWRSADCSASRLVAIRSSSGARIAVPAESTSSVSRRLTLRTFLRRSRAA